MKTRALFSVPAVVPFGLALSFFLDFAPTSQAATAAVPSPKMVSVERDVRLRGAISGTEENADTEPDDIFVRPALRIGRADATASSATAGGRTTSTNSSTGSGGGGPTHLSAHVNAAQWIEMLRQSLKGSEVNVALLGSHKYMVADCLGIKVSAGSFKLRLADPKIYFQGTALIFECGINHISLSAIKLRMKPNPNVLELCKFSKKFEVGGDADDITLKLRMDPLLDLTNCTVYGSILPEGTVRIGNLDLKPLQNDLDKAAKNAVEDALTAFLTFNFYDQINHVFDRMIEADCPGRDIRRGVESTLGIAKDGGGGGGASGSGGADVAALTQRIEQLEARVTALENPSPSASGAAPSTAGRTPALKAGTRAPATAAVSAPAVTASDMRAGGAAFEIVANPNLTGRLGRIVLKYPPGTKDLKARTEIFKSGETRGVRTVFGDVDVEMTPGTYDVDIGGHRVIGVVVEPRSDSQVKVGVLRLNAGGETRFEIFAVGGKKGLQTHFGQNESGLPIGTYEVEVNGQREKVTIQAGKITEY